MLLTPIDIQFSSAVFGNLTITLDPAFSSLSFSGRKRHTTLMLSSAAISRSADIFNYHTLVRRLSYCFTLGIFVFFSLSSLVCLFASPSFNFVATLLSSVDKMALGGIQPIDVHRFYAIVIFFSSHKPNTPNFTSETGIVSCCMRTNAY